MSTVRLEQVPQNKLTPKNLLIDEHIRVAWKPGSQVEIYSESQSKWNRGKIVKIFEDAEGEWMVIKYAGSTKEIQRFNECVRPIAEQMHSLKQQSSSSSSSSPSSCASPTNGHMHHHAMTNGAVNNVKHKPMAVGEYTVVGDNQIIATTQQTVPMELSINMAASQLHHHQQQQQQQHHASNGGTPATAGGGNASATAVVTTPRTPMTPRIPLNCPHGDNLSMEQLQSIKLRNRQVCNVRGLPSFATETLLRMKEWYGQFQGVFNITINTNKPKALTEKDSIAAFITFDNEFSATQAIHFSNTATFGDGRRLKAAFGIQYYCRNFLHSKPCTVVNCRYRHEWANAKDVITMHDLDDFKAKDCGLSRELMGSGGEGDVPNGFDISKEQLQKIMSEKIEMRMLNQQLTATNDKLKQQLVEIQLKYQALVADATKLQQNDNVKLLRLQQENERLRAENERLQAQAKLQLKLQQQQQQQQQECSAVETNQDEIKEFEARIETLQSENAALKKKNLKLSDEHNVLNIKYKELEQRLEHGSASKLNYLTWNARDVCNWIIALNTRQYEHYKDELLKNMLAEGIDGHCMSDLERSDLHRLGVTQFKDKKDIYHSIQQLTKSKEKKKFNLK